MIILHKQMLLLLLLLLLLQVLLLYHSMTECNGTQAAAPSLLLLEDA